MAPLQEVRPTSPASSARPRPAASRRGRPRRPSPWLRRFALGLAGLAALGAACLGPSWHVIEPGQASVPAASADPIAELSAWRDIPGAAPLFRLAPARADLALERAASRENQATGAREDAASFGRFGAGASLGLALRRAEPPARASFFVAIARLAAPWGLSTLRLGRAPSLPSRFGPLETAELTLTDGRQTRTCIGFRGDSADFGFGLVGWSCEDGTDQSARQRLTCLLDGLDLTEAASDLTLRAAFAASEPSPQCALANPPQAVAVPAPVVTPRPTPVRKVRVPSRTRQAAYTGG
jgi:hypothetical protein